MNIINSISNFFNHPFFIIVGGLTVTFSILYFLYKIICIIFGITPIILRLGTALWKRKIAIFGSDEAFTNLKDSLVDSKVFKEKNIINIKSNNLDKAKDETIFIVDWESFGDDIEQVFSCRGNHQTPIVIYAKPQTIPPTTMIDIGNRANTVVVNFRGRLLNDVLTSLITTSYDRSR